MYPPYIIVWVKHLCSEILCLYMINPEEFNLLHLQYITHIVSQCCFSIYNRDDTIGHINLY